VAYHTKQRRFNSAAWIDASICSVTEIGKSYHHNRKLEKGYSKKKGVVIDVFDSSLLLLRT
jgi:hypothetical protein